jgi:hypothetical protein
MDAADPAPPVSERPAHAEPAAEPEPPAAQFLTSPPVAVPTGVLQRPAIGVHWQPASPRRPQPSESSGLFRYNGAGLPVPPAPASPDLPRNPWVQPAPKPGDTTEARPSSRAPAAEPLAAGEENPWEA